MTNERDEERQNTKRENARVRAENEALVKIMAKLDPKELYRFGDRLMKRWLWPEKTQ
jgi:hypothetical protein